MDNLLNSVSNLVSLVSKEKIKFIASKLKGIELGVAIRVLPNLINTPNAQAAIKILIDSWEREPIASDELASMLLAASYAYHKSISDLNVELVWTGPVTPLVSVRRTEQVLLQVISEAKDSIFIVSFVAYDIDIIVEALNNVLDKGVEVCLLLESSKGNGGSLSFDSIRMMKKLLPRARIFIWQLKPEDIIGSVHAKIALADESLCFITSANLTGKAMNDNIEAGVLVSGGSIPKTLRNHLEYLLNLDIIKELYD